MSQPKTITQEEVDPKATHVLWNNREGICRIMLLQTLLDGWRKIPPRYAFLSNHNENDLLRNVFRSIFPRHTDKLSSYDLVGAVDTCSQSSRAMEQRMMLQHRINVPPQLLQDLVRITQADIAARQRARKAANLALQNKQILSLDTIQTDRTGTQIPLEINHDVPVAATQIANKRELVIDESEDENVVTENSQQKKSEEDSNMDTSTKD